MPLDVCTWAGATASAATRSVTVVETVDPGTSGTLDADAAVASGTTDPDGTNDTAEATTTVAPVADLAMALSDAPDPVVAGEDVTYTAVATNNGPDAADDVAIELTLPAGTTFVSATPDGAGNCTGTAVVDCEWTGSTAVAATRQVVVVATVDSDTAADIEASAVASSATADLDTNDNTAIAGTTVSLEADLQIEKSDGLDGAIDGATVVYSITVANDGPSDVVGATLADAIPAGLTDATWACVQGDSTATCPAAPGDAGTGDIAATIDLPAGTFLRYDLTATIGGAEGANVENTATVTAPAGVTDADTGNNTSTDQTLIVPIGIFADGFEDPGNPLTVQDAKRAQQRALQRASQR